MLNSSNKENIYTSTQSAVKNHKPTKGGKEKVKGKAKDKKLRQIGTATSISKSTNEDGKCKKSIRKSSGRKKQSICIVKNNNSFNDLSLKINLKKNKNIVRYHSDNLVSFRQYCSVEGQWIPLLSGTQRQKLINLMPQTQPSEDTRSKKSISEKQFVPEEKKLQNIFKDLQCNYLKKDAIFTELSELAKQKYSQLLTEILHKMGRKEQKQQKTPISSSRNKLTHQQNENVENDNSPIKFISQNFANEANNSDDLHHKVENLIRIRQAEQLTINFGPKSHKLVSGFTTIFEFTEVLFTKICEEIMVDRILANIRIAEGYPKLLKLKTILNEQQAYFSSSIIPDQIFQAIMEQNEFEEYVQIFSKCIFDALNGELIKLRPYYDTNGETFPWSFKMPNPITFYEINEETLGIAILQARTKIITAASQMCGIIVGDLVEEEKEIVDGYKMKKQIIAVKQDILSAQMAKKIDLQIQNGSTVLLVALSELIMGELCQQMGNMEMLV